MPDNDPRVATSGGASIGDLTIERGDFVNRDKIDIHVGQSADEVVEALRRKGLLARLTTRLPEESFRELLDLVARIALPDVGDRLYRACRASLPATAMLVNSDVPALLLWNMCEQPLTKAWPPLLECLERFAAADGIPAPVVSELRQWVDASAVVVNPIVPARDVERLRQEIRAEASKQDPKHEYSWLQVCLEPNWMNRTHERKQPLFRVELVLWSPKTGGALVLPTASQPEGAGQPPLWTLDDLPSLLDQVFATRETVALIPDMTLLGIEIVAPGDVLVHGFERWKRNKGQHTYGTLYPMVVRLSDRLTIPDPTDQKLADDYWRRKWNAFASLGQETCKALVWRAMQDLDAIELQDDAQAVGLGLSSPLLPGCREVFDAMRDAGIPIALWMRGTDLGLAAPADLFRQVCTLIERTRLSELREAIHGVRRLKEARRDAAHVGNALTLLWDDPDRRPLKYEAQGVFA